MAPGTFAPLAVRPQRPRPGPGDRAVHRAALPAHGRGAGRAGGRGAGSSPAGRRPPAAAARPRTIAVDCAAVPLGLAVLRALPPRADEPLRGLLRQAAWRLGATGLGGALLGGAERGCAALDDRLGAGGRLAAVPLAVPVGLGRRLRRGPARARASAERRPRTARTRPPAAVVPRHRDRRGRRPRRRRLRRARPRRPRRPPAGRGAARAARAVAAGRPRRLPRRRSASAPPRSGTGRCSGSRPATSADEPVLEADEADRWVPATVSGGPGSLVPWARPGPGGPPARPGVRPAGALPRPARPACPDLSIETVMGEPARADAGPGLRRAWTARRRRASGSTSRWPRWSGPAPSTGRCSCWSPRPAPATSTTSPSPPLQYLTLRRRRHGHAAVLQAALAAVPGQGRGRPRAEPAAVAAHPRTAPRPPAAGARGWCCSARASARTPARTCSCTGARWARRRSASTARCGSARRTAAVDARGDRRPTGSTSTADASPSSTTSPSSRRSARSGGARLRYVLVSHDNDGVTKFGPDLLTTAPDWLGPGPAARRRRSPGPARAASRRPCGGGRSRRSSRA